MTQSVPENPYLAARNEWNACYGGYVRSARVWALVAMISLVLCVVSTSFALYQSNAGAGGVPQHIQNADARVVRATLGAWVAAFRSVTPDSTVEKGYIDRVYALLHLEDPSTRKINDYFRDNSPFERAKKTTVSVEVSNVAPLSPQSWQIDWVETERDHSGKELKSSRYRGIAMVGLSPPEDETAMSLNPIGLYIKDFDWTAQL